MKNHLTKLLLLFVSIFWFNSYFLSDPVFSQSFYREKEAKVNFYRIGLGVGTFFPAPRPSYDEIENQLAPVLSLGVGKKYGSHFSLKSTFSFQPFSGEEKTSNGEIVSTDPIFQGLNYAFDVTPTFNLMPSFHHMSRPLVDIQAGIGIGYLLTYRSEMFSFEEKNYEFKFFESSVYFPFRVSSVFRLGTVTDLELEGAFFYTFLNDQSDSKGFKVDSDHFGQINLVYRRYLR